MSTIEETLRKSRQVDEMYKRFMAQKPAKDKQMQETLERIAKTQQTIQKTSQTLKSIDGMYQKCQDMFSKAVDSAYSGITKNMEHRIADPDWKPNHATEKDVAILLCEATKIIVLTGAGISVASGLPTFRGQGGYWTTAVKQENNQSQPPEQILTLARFRQNPYLTWQWLDRFWETKLRGKPNNGHIALHKILKACTELKKGVMLVSQNIDDFHQQAAHKNCKQVPYSIHQIHGNTRYIRCQSCTIKQGKLKLYLYSDYRAQLKDRKPAICPACQSQLRPNVMFFDEAYQQAVNSSETVNKFVDEADALIVIGTALQTGLASQIVGNCMSRNIDIVEINVEAEIKKKVVRIVQGKADSVLPAISLALRTI